MLSEDNLLVRADQSLLMNARDPNKLLMIRTILRQPNGGITHGEIPPVSWSKKHLGESYDKVILATAGIEALGSSPDNDFTVLGGWCVVRTKCLKEISEGNLIDPVTGKTTQIETTFDVAQWLKTAISIDQISEAVGIYGGTKYAAISEELLWTEKIIIALEGYFERKLNAAEKKEIQYAVVHAETKRYEMTKRYIEYCAGKKIELTQIVDKDIYDDLVHERSKLLKKIKTSVSTLLKPTIARIKEQKQILEHVDLEGMIKSITRYIKSYSLVWMMYTGPYFSILKKKGYVKTNKAIIFEPWSHLSGIEIEAKREFNYRLFGDNNAKNNYLGKGSINEDVAFIGLDDSASYLGKRYKLTKNISEVPNVHNFHQYIATLRKDSKINSLNLANNPAFCEGFNFFPYRKGRKCLLEMVRIKDEYRAKREHLKTQTHSSEELKKTVEKLRTVYHSKMQIVALELLNELEAMLETVFSSS